MKTILALSLLAALSAFALIITLSFEVGVSALFAAGLVAMFIADYARVLRPTPMRVAAETVSHERFQLAA